MLEVRDLTVWYGRLPALQEVSLSVPQGSVVGLLGSNGAGKSTLLKAVAGLVPARAGDVLLDGRSLDGLPAHRRARMGVCLIPEGRGIFPSLTVEDNVHLALGGDAPRAETAFEYFPVLRERRTQLAGTLSGGEQQMLALARAVGTDPALLMADELSLGLAPLVVQSIAETLRALHRDHGRTILLVEQYAAQVLALADLVYILQRGRVVWAGESGELRASRVLARSYLGAGR